MTKTSHRRFGAAAIGTILLASALTAPFGLPVGKEAPITPVTALAADTITLADMPQEYEYAAKWIWENRITNEDSTGSKAKRYNSIFDQIIDGKGTINYVVKWQSYKTVTLQQRQQFEVMLSDSINAWAQWLSGYENWPYDHIDVNVVGWAVIDKSCLLDLQADEIVYTDTKYYDSQYDTSNGYEEIPNLEPYAPSELSRFDHFYDEYYEYPGGLDKRFDMYMWATQGFPSIGGCGGDWGQRLSDDAYLNMVDGSGIHVLEHEIGHGFGITDFYGGEGASDGFPPGGFPSENGGSLMMAGSSAEITDFDGWLLRYMWTQIKDESGRFNIEEVEIPSTEPTTEPITVTTTTAPPIIVETTTTAVNAGIITEKVSAQITPGDSDDVWYFDSNGADAVELTFEGDALGGGYGVLAYNNGENTEVTWEGRLDENGKMVLTVDLSDDLYTTVTVKKHYAGVWDNELGDMKDITLNLSNVNLIYSGEAVTTTTTTATTPGVNGEPAQILDKVVEINDDYIVFENEGTLTFGEGQRDEFDRYGINEGDKIMMAFYRGGDTIVYIVAISKIIDVYGDVNDNGEVDIADAVAIMSYVTNPDANPLDSGALDRGDVYQCGDGIGINDAVSIQKYLTKLISELPESYE